MVWQRAVTRGGVTLFGARVMLCPTDRREGRICSYGMSALERERDR